MTEPERSERPKTVRADPRTDGMDDLGMYDLDPPSDEEIEAGVAYDRPDRTRVLRDLGEFDEEDDG